MLSLSGSGVTLWQDIFDTVTREDTTAGFLDLFALDRVEIYTEAPSVVVLHDDLDPISRHDDEFIRHGRLKCASDNVDLGRVGRIGKRTSRSCRSLVELAGVLSCGLTFLLCL